MDYDFTKYWQDDWLETELLLRLHTKDQLFLPIPVKV